MTRRFSDISSALTVTLATNDATEATVASAVTIPTGQTTVAFIISLVDDALLDGTQTVRITASAAGTLSGSDTFDVTDFETLTVSLVTNSIVEGSGGGATTGTVTRSNTDISSALTVTLGSSDTTEATVPGTVTIAAGQSSATFSVAAVDDTLLDGTQPVTVSATAAGYLGITDTIDVLDFETLTVVLAADSIVEGSGAGATTGTVTRSNTDNNSALTVTLESNDTSEATVPATVTIAAGQSSATFSVTAVEDTLLDGTQSVTVTASAAGYLGITDTIDVLDFETLTVVLAADSIVESSGAGATTGTVTRSNTDNSSALTVTLESNDTSEATVPATVTIAAGQSSATFSVAAVDDTLLDGTQPVTVTPSAAGYLGVTDSMDVTDFEKLELAITPTSIGESTAATGTVTRNTDSSLPLTVTLSSDDTTEATVPASVTILANQSTVTFTINALDDGMLDGVQTVIITAGAADYVSGNASLDVFDFNAPPTLDAVANPAAIAEDAGLQTVNLTGITAGGGESQALRVTATSSNTGLILNPTVTYTSSNTTGALSYAPLANQNGSATITVTVRDAGLDDVPGNADDAVIERTFVVSVNAVNDPPALAALGNQSVDEGVLLTFAAIANDVDTPADTLTFSLDAGAPTGAAIDPSSGVFMWTPTEAQGPGTFDVTVRVTDDGTPNLNDFETITITVNDAVLLLSPLGASFDTLPRFRWTTFEGAETYSLWVNDMTRRISGVVKRFRLPMTEFAPPHVFQPGMYWFEVRPEQPVRGAWSQRGAFQITETSTTPTITDPTETTAFPTVAWSQVTGATHFDVRITDTNDVEVVSVANLVSTEFIPTLAPGTYRASVQAHNNSGPLGSRSAVHEFTVASSIPVTNGNRGQVTDATPLFDWDPVPGAFTSEIWVDDRTDGDRKEVWANGLFDSTFQTRGVLQQHEYQWQIKITGFNGRRGGWSPVSRFSIDVPTPDSPTIISPVMNSQTLSTTPTFAWNPVSWAFRYDLFVNNLTTG